MSSAVSSGKAMASPRAFSALAAASFSRLLQVDQPVDGPGAAVDFLLSSISTEPSTLTVPPAPAPATRDSSNCSLSAEKLPKREELRLLVRLARVVESVDVRGALESCDARVSVRSVSTRGAPSEPAPASPSSDKTSSDVAPPCEFKPSKSELSCPPQPAGSLAEKPRSASATPGWCESSDVDCASGVDPLIAVVSPALGGRCLGALSLASEGEDAGEAVDVAEAGPFS